MTAEVRQVGTEAAKTGGPAPDEVERVVRRAKRQARRWIGRLPEWMDHDAFAGEALLAVAIAIRRYRPETGVPFSYYACRKVRYALLKETHRQYSTAAEGRPRIEPASPCPPPVIPDAGAAEDDAVEGPVDPRPGPEELVLRDCDSRCLQAALDMLQPRERQVLRLRFWDGRTRESIAAGMGVSRARVDQIERRALRKMREWLESDR